MGNECSLELAEILGLLCAEGCYVFSQTEYLVKNETKPRKQKHTSIRIEFYNKDNRLVEHYQSLLKKEFAYSTTPTSFGKVIICKRSIISCILSFTALGHLKWSVPSCILFGSQALVIAFIRGYFDGDGTCSTNVRFFSTNLNGLKQIEILLNRISFMPTWPSPYLKAGRKPLYTLQISRKDQERFLNMIRPISKRPRCGDYRDGLPSRP